MLQPLLPCRAPWTLVVVVCLCVLLAPSWSSANFVAFESGQVRPLALSPDGQRLFAVNTPDNRLEVWDVAASGLTHLHSVPVGLEPVAVAARDDSEVWVVNHLSDSVSIVDVGATPPRVVRTLLVGDAPADIVFAGTGGGRAFITTAHRGQASPYTDAANPGEFITPGIGRADVWVFDVANLGTSLGGNPLAVVTLFGDTPRALATDGDTVYAAAFKSGNRTTTINEGAVCNGGQSAPPCQPASGELFAPGGLPDPNPAGRPEVGLIVRFDGSNWVDELSRSWDPMVRFDLPDLDVFALDANAAPASMEASAVGFAGVGTVLYNMVVHPTNGKVYVTNTEAINHVRFEGERPPANPVTSVRGHLHEARVTVIDPTGPTVSPRHLNKHIDYGVVPSPAGTAEKSLATPMGMALSSDGTTLYVTALGSDKVGIFDTAELDADTFVPDSANHVVLPGDPTAGAGPTGLVLDETHNRLYVLTRFDNSIAVVDIASRTQVASHGLHNPEPASITDGRRFLYDSVATSTNGEASCSACHVFGDLDDLAWDLGDPLGSVLNNPNPFTLGPIGDPDFHPMKGPMTTQTLRGMADHGPMHWRGDRTAGNDPGGDPLDEDEAFKKFNPAFVGLLGRDTELSAAEMQAYTDFILQLTHPPNPIRALDDSLTLAQEAGRDFYFTFNVDTLTCNGCHVLDPAQGFFGADGRSSFEGETQHLKIPHLVNAYTKVGMFGMPDVAFVANPEPNPQAHMGDQIRGFGFTHDGAIDTLLHFLRAVVFNFPSDAVRREVEQFLFAFDAPLKPVVGQQTTLDDGNSAVVEPRIDLLIQRSSLAVPDSDLVVKGTVGGEARGWVLQSNGTFKSDKAAEAPLSDTALRALAQTPGQELTYTAVPPGCGERIGVDRDGDASLDGDDCAPADAAVHPNATELCADGMDNDCDGLADGADPDCQAGPMCGDMTCDVGEDSCSCAADCGAPPVNESTVAGTCSDGLDNDCDGLADGADPDCQAGPMCGDMTCDVGEDSCSCSTDCGAPPVNESFTAGTCLDSLDNDCDGDTDLADVDCSCLPAGFFCQQDAQCCSGNCRGRTCR